MFEVLRRWCSNHLVVLATFAWCPLSYAAVIVETFEAFADSTSITTQIPGLTFSNATALRAGMSLNEADFPPRSGVTVAVNTGSIMTIDFSTPVQDVTGYFTYNTSAGLTLTAFDASLTPIDSASSLFATNFVSSGIGAPNEAITLDVAGISRVVITGAFTLDDLTFVTGASVSEPATLALLGLALAGLGVRRQRQPSIARGR